MSERIVELKRSVVSATLHNSKEVKATFEDSEVNGIITCYHHDSFLTSLKPLKCDDGFYYPFSTIYRYKIETTVIKRLKFTYINVRKKWWHWWTEEECEITELRGT